ncbi:MAG: hypothetical protein ACI81L_000698 [Verrucomicrobiales bacterium]
MCEADGKAPEFGVDWRTTWSRFWWLCPITADSSSVPSQHCVGFDDQKRVPCSLAVHCRVEQCEDCRVGVSEPRPADLALENPELVAEGEDLSGTGVAGSEHPAETCENETNEGGDQSQERRMVPTSPMPETLGITWRMSIWHPTRRTGGPSRVLRSVCPCRDLRRECLDLVAIDNVWTPVASVSAYAVFGLGRSGVESLQSPLNCRSRRGHPPCLL